MRVLLTGGVTGGHINPALAIADTIRQNDPSAEIAFVGIETGKEVDLVPREGYKLHFVDARGFDRERKFSLDNLKALWLAWYSPRSKKTNRILEDFQPDIVIGTGGYASWPLMKAAVKRGIPTALHESNALPGVTARKLQHEVDRIWVNFPGTEDRLQAKDKILLVGNPTRAGFGALSRSEARKKLGIDGNRKMILSFGGSGGATDVSRAVIDTMAELAPKRPDLLHIHATGKRDYRACMEWFREAGLDRCSNCILVEYIYDMPLRMAAADLVISRAGAMTLSELALMKKASILIPFPDATDNHQYVNAKAMADAGGAALVEQDRLGEGRLTRVLTELIDHEDQRVLMGERAALFAKPDANRLIWQDIREILKQSI